MSLPLLWDLDYDGTRWIYRYKPTGHVQYQFPREGDEFPEFLESSSSPVRLTPEELLASQQQVAAARRATQSRPVTSSGWGSGGLRPDPMDDDDVDLNPPESFMYFGPGTYTDISPVIDGGDDDGRATPTQNTEEISQHGDWTETPSVGGDGPGETGDTPLSTGEVRNATPADGLSPLASLASPHPAAQQVADNVQDIDVVPVGAVPAFQARPEHPSELADTEVPFDPVGVLAEMPTEWTGRADIELNPNPVEMADNNVLAPIETALVQYYGPAELPAHRSPVDPPNAASSSNIVSPPGPVQKLNQPLPLVRALDSAQIRPPNRPAVKPIDSELTQAVEATSEQSPRTRSPAQSQAGHQQYRHYTQPAPALALDTILPLGPKTYQPYLPGTRTHSLDASSPATAVPDGRKFPIRGATFDISMESARTQTIDPGSVPPALAPAQFLPTTMDGSRSRSGSFFSGTSAQDTDHSIPPASLTHVPAILKPANGIPPGYGRAIPRLQSQYGTGKSIPPQQQENRLQEQPREPLQQQLEISQPLPASQTFFIPSAIPSSRSLPPLQYRPMNFAQPSLALVEASTLAAPVDEEAVRSPPIPRYDQQQGQQQHYQVLPESRRADAEDKLPAWPNSQALLQSDSHPAPIHLFVQDLPQESVSSGRSPPMLTKDMGPKFNPMPPEVDMQPKATTPPIPLAEILPELVSSMSIVGPGLSDEGDHLPPGQKPNDQFPVKVTNAQSSVFHAGPQLPPKIPYDVAVDQKNESQPQQEPPAIHPPQDQQRSVRESDQQALGTLPLHKQPSGQFAPIDGPPDQGVLTPQKSSQTIRPMDAPLHLLGQLVRTQSPAPLPLDHLAPISAGGQNMIRQQMQIQALQKQQDSLQQSTSRIPPNLHYMMRYQVPQRQMPGNMYSADEDKLSPRQPQLPGQTGPYASDRSPPDHLYARRSSQIIPGQLDGQTFIPMPGQQAGLIPGSMSGAMPGQTPGPSQSLEQNSEQSGTSGRYDTRIPPLQSTEVGQASMQRPWTLPLDQKQLQPQSINPGNQLASNIPSTHQQHPIQGAPYPNQTRHGSISDERLQSSVPIQHRNQRHFSLDQVGSSTGSVDNLSSPHVAPLRFSSHIVGQAAVSGEGVGKTGFAERPISIMSTFSQPGAAAEPPSPIHGSPSASTPALDQPMMPNSPESTGDSKTSSQAVFPPVVSTAAVEASRRPSMVSLGTQATNGSSFTPSPLETPLSLVSDRSTSLPSADSGIPASIAGRDEGIITAPVRGVSSDNQTGTSTASHVNRAIVPEDRIALSPNMADDGLQDHKTSQQDDQVDRRRPLPASLEARTIENSPSDNSFKARPQNRIQKPNSNAAAVPTYEPAGQSQAGADLQQGISPPRNMQQSAPARLPTPTVSSLDPAQHLDERFVLGNRPAPLQPPVIVASSPVDHLGQPGGFPMLMPGHRLHRIDEQPEPQHEPLSYSNHTPNSTRRNSPASSPDRGATSTVGARAHASQDANQAVPSWPQVESAQQPAQQPAQQSIPSSHGQGQQKGPFPMAGEPAAEARSYLDPSPPAVKEKKWKTWFKSSKSQPQKFAPTATVGQGGPVYIPPNSLQTAHVLQQSQSGSSPQLDQTQYQFPGARIQGQGQGPSGLGAPPQQIYGSSSSVSTGGASIPFPSAPPRDMQWHHAPSLAVGSQQASQRRHRSPSQSGGSESRGVPAETNRTLTRAVGAEAGSDNLSGQVNASSINSLQAGATLGGKFVRKPGQGVDDGPGMSVEGSDEGSDAPSNRPAKGVGPGADPSPLRSHPVSLGTLLETADAAKSGGLQSFRQQRSERNNNMQSTVRSPSPLSFTRNADAQAPEETLTGQTPQSGTKPQGSPAADIGRLAVLSTEASDAVSVLDDDTSTADDVSIEVGLDPEGKWAKKLADYSGEDWGKWE